MFFIKNLIIGFFIGSGAILPGISSGVLCVIFGIYEKLLDSILNFFSNVKENFKFLLPILIGTFFGVISFGNILMYFFNNYPLQVKSIFIGLILGSVPSLLKQVTKKTHTKPKFSDIIFIVLSCLLGIFLVSLENTFSSNLINTSNFLYLVLCGFLMSIGVVVPGISSTVILMLLGVYQIYISSVSMLNLPVLIPMGIGLFLGCIIFMKLIKFLLDKFYIKTFYSIIGFTIGSIFVLFPNSIYSILDLLICILDILLGLLLSRFFERKC